MSILYCVYIKYNTHLLCQNKNTVVEYNMPKTVTWLIIFLEIDGIEVKGWKYKYIQCY